MGGKIWSDAEERYFWRIAVSQSSKRAALDLSKPEKPWDQLAREMQTGMGNDARREYTGNMLFEHFFQNIETQRRSPNASFYVREYLARRDQSRHPVNQNAAFDPCLPSSTSRRSYHIEFITEPNTTSYTPKRHHTYPGGSSHAVSSYASPSNILSTSFHQESRHLDSTRMGLGTRCPPASLETGTQLAKHTASKTAGLEEGRD
ncbi:putative yhr100cp-like protein [Rosellinia necatrix]|uniref:Putative yhr100cp-like protein n=1 Tax=Rosellinia necatrix TaxID=77044 RepID=A0A1S8A5Q0_ROSNE|nr:putative yhr100cp-like protein [Rosellinia necatrix]